MHEQPADAAGPAPESAPFGHWPTRQEIHWRTRPTTHPAIAFRTGMPFDIIGESAETDMNRPNPQLRIKTSQFLLGDALEWLEVLPDRHFALAVTSPPYNIGKPYETQKRWSLDEYLLFVEKIVALLVPKIADTGSICWQVGNYIKNGELFPLDIYTHNLFRSQGMKLRNRIIWRFNFGHNASHRFSGRYETVLWFSKTDNYIFNLDPVRVPQLYPGKRHASTKGSMAGQPSGNPKGKNPADFWEFSAERAFNVDPIWDVPNVKANHPEHTFHPCQFPIELAE